MTADCAVGFCDPDACVPPGFRAVPGRLAVVVAGTAPHATPHDRLGACVVLHDRLQAFLPLPPRRMHRETDAAMLLEYHGAALVDRLAVVAGCFEATLGVDFAPTASVSGGCGRTWLAARATALRTAARVLDRAVAALDAMTDDLDVRDRRSDSGPGWVQLSVLLPLGSLVELRHRTTTLDASDVGATLTVTAPWPVFSFALPGGMA